MKRYVFDSYALIAFFENEQGADIVENALRELITKKAFGWMSVINWGEVYYSTYRELGIEMAEKAISQIKMYPIEIVDADQGLTKDAALLKSRYRVAYADCFAVALANKMKAIVLTGDPEFKALQKNVEVLWIIS